MRIVGPLWHVQLNAVWAHLALCGRPFVASAEAPVHRGWIALYVSASSKHNLSPAGFRQVRALWPIEFHNLDQVDLPRPDGYVGAVSVTTLEDRPGGCFYGPGYTPTRSVRFAEPVVAQNSLSTGSLIKAPELRRSLRTAFVRARQ